MRTKPLNGTRIHPLSVHAIGVLRRLAERGPMPYQDLNPGVAARFECEALIEGIMQASPYKTHKGRSIRFAQITQAGRDKLHWTGAAGSDRAARDGVPW